MSDSVSFLPEDLRKKEGALKQAPAAVADASGLKFSVPKQEDEDIEVIEIDEGEIEQVLANEPLIARLLYKATSFFEEVKIKLFASGQEEPAPKLPPQFFTPPPAKPAIKPGEVGTQAAAPGAGIGAKAPGVLPAAQAGKPALGGAMGASKARIMPMTATPHRVRVIKRVRKPVRVSFVSSDDVRLMQIDVPKRRFTLVALSVMFFALMGGGWFLLDAQRAKAQESKMEADKQLAEVKQQIQERQKTWNEFQNLEPRLRALSGLLGSHVSPSNLLQSIEERTLPSVSYSAFSVTADGRLQLAVTADSLANAARQIVSFSSSGFVKSLDAGNYTLNYDPKSEKLETVQFQLNLQLTPDVFAFSRPSSTISIAQ